MANLLFWSFVNEATTADKAKKYYLLFGLGANAALVFSGQYICFFACLRVNLPPSVDPWDMLLTYSIGCSCENAVEDLRKW